MTRHAPRERVSWNGTFWFGTTPEQVTLHVSVWVEMIKLSLMRMKTTKSRSTWACELKSTFKRHLQRADTSRSTWACELKYDRRGWWHSFAKSRSTWACELKFPYSFQISLLLMSRSTWACELKYSFSKNHKRENGHAPRERVSWNLK